MGEAIEPESISALILAARKTENEVINAVATDMSNIADVSTTITL